MDLKLHTIIRDICVGVTKLNGPKISRSLTSWPLSDQVVLEFKNTKWFITDNKSFQGVYLNGEKIDVSVPMILKGGSCVSLGPPNSVLIKYEFFFGNHNGFCRCNQKRRMRKALQSVCSGTNCTGPQNDSKPSASVRKPRSQQRNESISAVTGPITRSRAAKEREEAFDKDAKKTQEVIVGESNQAEERMLKGRKRVYEYEGEDYHQSRIKQNNADGRQNKRYLTIEQERLNELKECEKKCSELDSKIVQQEAKFTQSVEEILEKSYTCSVCTELYIKAISLDCAHTFCGYCLKQCLRHSKLCPLCRAVIVRQHKSVAIDNFIDDMVGKLGKDYQERRKKVITERKEAEESRRQECRSQPSSSRLPLHGLQRPPPFVFNPFMALDTENMWAHPLLM